MEPLLKPRNWDSLVRADAVCDELRRPFILSGYRGAGFCRCWTRVGRSVFDLHNESGNIITHAAWVPIFLTLFVRHIARGGDVLGGFHLLSACAMAFSSSVYHWLGWHSERVYHCALCIDVSCIIITTVSSVNWGVSIVFCDRPLALWSYVTLFNSAALVALAYPLTARRVAAFIATTIFPAAHAVLGGVPPETEPALRCTLQALAFIFVAGIFYVSQWPERRWPGACDFVLQSHQFWHLFVAASALVFYNGMSESVSTCAAHDR